MNGPLAKVNSPDTCATSVDPTESGDPKKPKIDKTRKGAWDDKGTDTIYQTLEEDKYKDLMSAKISETDLKAINCPRFHSLGKNDKKKFWAIFLASMVAKEGENNPKEFYGESGTNDSYGLLQIDTPNSIAHGCRLKDGSKPKGSKKGRSGGGDMYDPHINLRCGMMILRNQVKKKGKLFDNKSYWAVLRTNRPTPHARMKTVLHKHMTQVSACTSPPGLTGETEISKKDSSRMACVGLTDDNRNGTALPVSFDNETAATGSEVRTL